MTGRNVPCFPFNRNSSGLSVKNGVQVTRFSIGSDFQRLFAFPSDTHKFVYKKVFYWFDAISLPPSFSRFGVNCEFSTSDGVINSYYCTTYCLFGIGPKR